LRFSPLSPRERVRVRGIKIRKKPIYPLIPTFSQREKESGLWLCEN
jgi:hypothetical protein